MNVRRRSSRTLSLGTAALLLAGWSAPGCSFGNGSAPSSRAAATRYFQKVGPPVSAQPVKGRRTRGGAVAKVKSIKGRIFRDSTPPE